MDARNFFFHYCSNSRVKHRDELEPPGSCNTSNIKRKPFGRFEREMNWFGIKSKPQFCIWFDLIHCEITVIMTQSEARKGKLESFPDGEAAFYQALGGFLKNCWQKKSLKKRHYQWNNFLQIKIWGKRLPSPLVAAGGPLGGVLTLEGQKPQFA